MSDAIVTFQSQLSGVMETVFKAAMYEITRLVEDSFLEEVSRSREQVESLKQRLQWSESRRREREGGGRTRCADCGRVGVPSEETEEDRPSGTQSGVDEGRGLKQEKVLEGSWSSCPGEGSNPGPPHALEAVATPSSVGAPSGCTPTARSDLDGDGLDAMLKEEALQTAPPAGLEERWAACLEGQDGPEVAGPDGGFVQRLHVCEEEWGSEAGPGAGPGREGGDGEELAHAYEAQYSMGEGLGIELEAEPKGEYMVTMLGFPAQLDPASPAHRLAPHGRRAGFPQGSSPPVTDSELDCLLINEDGFLQDAERRYRSARRGRGRRGGGPCGEHQLPGLDGTADRQRGEPFGLLPNPSGLPPAPPPPGPPSGPPATAPYSCTQCGKSFTQACNLKVHQRIHQGQGLHLCSHCGKGFLSFADLKRHKCSHAGEKPYCCSLCGNKFSRLWNLKLHRRIHTQEKPHRCAQCGKSFTRADILKVHHRTHTGERPYCCAICGLSFKRLDHLKSHQRKHS